MSILILGVLMKVMAGGVGGVGKRTAPSLGRRDAAERLVMRSRRLATKERAAMIRGFHRRESGIHRWWQVVQGRGGVEDKIPGVYGPRGI
jgi:hypothetical protein